MVGLPCSRKIYFLGIFWGFFHGEDELGGLLELCGLEGSDGLDGGDLLGYVFLDEGNHLAGNEVLTDEFDSPRLFPGLFIGLR